MSVTAPSDEDREGFLRASVMTYLSEEIKAEGLVRDLGSFSRFLDVAALAAGQTTNVSNIARDAAVSRETVRGYFEVLVDTLIGHWLPAYRPRAKVKEVALQKFYWFDPGVLHAAAGGFDQPVPGDWDGVLLEHLLLHEIQSYVYYAGVKGSLGYWDHAVRQRGGLRLVARPQRRGHRGQARTPLPARVPEGAEALLAGRPGRSCVVYWARMSSTSTARVSCRWRPSCAACTAARSWGSGPQ